MAALRTGVKAVEAQRIVTVIEAQRIVKVLGRAGEK